jgi:hypothetical protein
MQPRRFGRKLKLPSTIAIKHQIKKSMFEDSMKAELRERAEALLPAQPPISVLKASPV